MIKRILGWLSGGRRSEGRGAVQAGPGAGGAATGPTGPTEPTADEMTAARQALALAARSATVMQVGGARPPETRAASWWGGNFIAEPPREGLVPLVQIAAKDLPPAHRKLIDADFLLIWMDPAFDMMDPDRGLEIAGFDAPDPASLPETERACRMAGALATLPLLPGKSGIQLPSWEDFAGQVPRAVARSGEKDWFFGAPQIAPEDEEPVIIGGWPQWIQGGQWPEGAAFVMEIRSTQKGRLGIGDSGSFYLFRGADGWIVRLDFF